MGKSRPVGVVFVISGYAGNVVGRVMLNCIQKGVWKQRICSSLDECGVF